MSKLFCSFDSIKEPSRITPYTFVHILSGMLLYLYIIYIYPGISYINALMIVLFVHTLYEIKDLQYYFNQTHHVDVYDDNSFINSVYDTIACVIGVYIASYYIHRPLSFNNVLTYTIMYVLLVLLFLTHYTVFIS